ncbi:MAG: hypothetical protein WCO96_08200 [Actinomycetes bacterium]
MSGDGGNGGGRVLIAVLVLQLVIAAVFIVLVATDSIPLPKSVVGAFDSPGVG